MPQVTIFWSYPRKLVNVLEDQPAIAYEKGIYFITRINRGKVSPLYIGKASRDFYSRLVDHANTWLNLPQYRAGIKYVRFGTMRNREDMDTVIRDVEAASIFNASDKLYKNIKCMHSYNSENSYFIINSGYRGGLELEIDMKRH